MRSITQALFVLSLCGSLVSQVPGAKVTKTPAQDPTNAAAELRELSTQHKARMADVAAGDDAAKSAAMATYVAALGAFVRKHSRTAEGNRVRQQIGFLATADRAHLDAAKQALASFDVTIGAAGAGIMAVRTAGRLGLTEIRSRLMDAVSARAKTITERMDLVMNLKFGMKEIEWADKLLAATEAMATTDETKAELLLGKADMTRHGAKDPVAYNQALAEIVTVFPDTRIGRLVADKLAAAKLSVGSEPIPFTAKDLQGKPVSLGDYRGKVLLIDFWATWCKPCMKEMPSIVACYRKHHDQGFEVLGVSLDRESGRAKLATTIAANDMSWRHVCDGQHWKADLAQRYDVTSIPFTVLIGRDGKVAGLGLHGDLLAAAVKAALEAK